MGRQHDVASGHVTGLLLFDKKKYNRGLGVDWQVLGLREASESTRIRRDNS